MATSLRGCRPETLPESRSITTEPEFPPSVKPLRHPRIAGGELARRRRPRGRPGVRRDRVPQAGVPIEAPEIEKTVSGCRRSCYFATSHERPVGISTPSKPRLCGEREAESVFVERAAQWAATTAWRSRSVLRASFSASAATLKPREPGNLMFGIISPVLIPVEQFFRVMPE
jgi:hypothetical protein